MKNRTMTLLLGWLIIGLSLIVKAQASEAQQILSTSDLDKLVSQPVDLSPWAYAWRADRQVQEKPEACFIPRRLERIDKVYRTALPELGKERMKSPHHNQPDLLIPLPPPPKGRLLAALLWIGGVSQYQVALHWPGDAEDIPSPETVEVRVYPTAWGWFGWTVDKILGRPEISADRRTWTYTPEPGTTMDFSYSKRVAAATEMVAVFATEGSTASGGKPVMPSIRVTGPSLGAWKRMDVEIEWGFQSAEKKTDFDGRIEAQMALVGSVSPLAEDKGTRMTGANSWQSRRAGDARRGIVVPLVYAPEIRKGLDSRITVWTTTTGFTIRVRDLENGPIFIPRHGIFVTKAGSGKTGKTFAAELAARNLKSIRQLTREHREAASYEEVLREVKLWRCPPGTAVTPFPAMPEEPSMQVQGPDQHLVGIWQAAINQLRGKHMWGTLSFEVARVTRAMEMVGLHDETAKLYDYFLKSPGVKTDGDYADPKGSLERGTGMRHDMGYYWDSVCCSTGRLLLSMAERYFLTGDKEWFQRNRARLQAAADFIVRERHAYMKDIPNRKDLFVAGLMPPNQLGDYAMPACDWRWYYVDSALALQGLSRFADVMMEVAPETGRMYRAEAEAFRGDVRRVVEREAALAPVQLGCDGTYRTYIPRMPYAAGQFLFGPESRVPQYGMGVCDLWMGALPLAEPYAALDASDFRIVDSLDGMEDTGTLWTTKALDNSNYKNDASKEKAILVSFRLPKSLHDEQAGRKKKGLSVEDAWFWRTYTDLPKASHNANIYLLQDDVPNFLRFLMNSAVPMVSADGKFWEHERIDSYSNCTHPDNGTSGWFVENFRNMLVMEIGDALWLARATPRSWLEQGKRIAVKNAPTYFGTVAFEIVSDVDNRKINATVEMPARKTPESVVLRSRHPQSAPIQGVTVNGKEWKDFDKDKETITLKGLTGSVAVTAKY